MRFLTIDGWYFQDALRSMGHEVMSIGKGQGHDLSIDSMLSLKGLTEFLEAKSFRPDVVLWSDTCGPPMVIGFEALPAVTIGYSIDQYCNPWHLPYAAAFDCLLLAQKPYVELFEREGHAGENQWFPLFCNTKRDRDPGEKRDVPVSFVGTVEGSINTERRTFLDTFKARHPLIVKQGKYAPLYGRSQIVLNQSAAGELNFRLFEAAACGAAVLTETTDQGLLDLFTPGVHILPTYPKGDAATAAEIASAALLEPEKTAEIAATGRDAVQQRHSEKARAKQIVHFADKLLRKQSFKRRQAYSKIVAEELGKAFAMLAGDEKLPLSAELRKFFLDVGARYALTARGA